MQARPFIVTALFALLIGSAPIAAAQEAQTVTGELLRVDLDVHILAIEDAEGNEWQFRYDERTEVTGADEGIAGLAASEGMVVTVDFTDEDVTYRATRIYVHPES